MFECNLRKRFGAVALVLALALVCVSSNSVDNSYEGELQIMAPDGIVNKLFGWMPSFEQFKTKYHKNYGSIVEEMRRKSILMANELRAWVSQMNFKRKTSSSFMITTEMSDKTKDELESTSSIYGEKYKEHLEVLRADTEATGDDAKISGWLEKILVMGGKAAINLAAKLAGKPKYQPELPDEVFIDHRQGDTCLNEPRDQGRCDSCYIFSSISLYEWAYCKQERTRIKFSEQYILDCGHLTGLSGCDGGFESEVARFIKHNGFELLDEYRHELRRKICPRNAELIKPDDMGRILLEKPSLSFVWPNKIDKDLEKSPLLIQILASDTFFHYGGGVDDGKGCKFDRYMHSVLLVGSGRRDGHEYWIIRNSHGPWWGEFGYYRVRRDSNCLVFIGTLKLKTVPGEDKDSKNRFYYNSDYKGQPKSADNSN